MPNAGTDIFGYNRKSPSAVFSAENASMSITGTDAEGGTQGLLVQNWGLKYRHDVQEIYEIGSSNLYWVRGHPIGNGSIGRILGIKGGVKFFSDDAYDICKGGVSFNINMKPGFCDTTNLGATPIKLTLTGCVVTDIGFNVTAQDVKILEDITFRFGSLQTA